MIYSKVRRAAGCPGTGGRSRRGSVPAVGLNVYCTTWRAGHDAVAVRCRVLAEESCHRGSFAVHQYANQCRVRQSAIIKQLAKPCREPAPASDVGQLAEVLVVLG